MILLLLDYLFVLERRVVPSMLYHSLQAFSLKYKVCFCVSLLYVFMFSVVSYFPIIHLCCDIWCAFLTNYFSMLKCGWCFSLISISVSSFPTIGSFFDIISLYLFSCVTWTQSEYLQSWNICRYNFASSIFLGFMQNTHFLMNTSFVV